MMNVGLLKQPIYKDCETQKQRPEHVIIHFRKMFYKQISQTAGPEKASDTIMFCRGYGIDFGTEGILRNITWGRKETGHSS